MTENRRDVSTRKVAAIQNLAKKLVAMGFTPNQISVVSAVVAIVAGVALGMSHCITSLWLFVVAIIGIQLRLLCNLLDGLMAVEGGLKTPSGELFNDVPDRISDAVIIIGAGYGAYAFSEKMIYLGWLAALLAVCTAYIRALGASLTGRHDFSGPMAKQHRMFLVTVGCLGSIVECFGVWPRGYSLVTVLAIIAVGSFLTCVNRLVKLYRTLESRPKT